MKMLTEAKLRNLLATAFQRGILTEQKARQLDAVAANECRSEGQRRTLDSLTKEADKP